MTFSNKFVVALAFSTALGSMAHAEDSTHYDEPGISYGREYLAQHFAERIDPFTGNLSLQFADLVIPGNAGFDMRVQRSYNASAINGTSSPFGRGWDIHFGRVAHRADQLCAGATPQTMALELPDGSRHTFHKSNGVAATSGTDYLTTNFWKGQCDAGGGMIVFSPDGTRYDMTEANGAYWYAKKITDRFGNFMNLSYVLNSTTGREDVTQVSANDGRLITFNYSGGKLLSIAGGGVTWNYTVSTISDGSYQLAQVTPPAGGSWLLSYNGNLQATAGSFALHQVTNPFGGVITYSYIFVNFLPGFAGWAPVTAVQQKVAGSDTWTYSYAPSCPNGGDDSTTVALPEGKGNVVYQHFGYCTVAAGEVWKIGLLHVKTTSSAQTETLSWTPQAISAESTARPGYLKFDTQVNRPLLAQRAITRDGVAYTTANSSFDTFGNATNITATGNKTRTRTLSYFNSTPLWIVGLADDETISGVGTISRNRGSVGQLSSEVQFDVTTSFTYSADGSLSSRTDAKPVTTTLSNYLHGIPTLEVRPEGVTISRAVDSLGNVTSRGDGDFTWGFSYDAIGRTTLVDFPVGSDATITWTNTSKAITRGAFSETTQFDGFGNPASVTRAGILRTFLYDAFGRRKFESLPGSPQGTTVTYDILGRVAQSQSPAGTRTFSYSSGSVTVTDELGHATAHTFDRYGDPDDVYLTGISTPVAAASVTMQRDSIGTLLSATQNGVTRTYNRDTRLYLTSIAEPEVGTTTYGRDGVGNMTSRGVGGQTTFYTYDGLSRLSTISASGVSSTLGYNHRSKVTSVDNTAASRAFAYDANANLTQDKLTIDGQVFTIDYGFDAIDGLASITYPMSKGVVTYAPDSLGRPTNTLPLLNSVSHYPSGNFSSIVFANGVGQSYGENTLQLPTTISAGGIVGLAYSYDNAGNVSAITDSVTASESRTLGYDAIDRLTTANGPWGTGAITYDGSGNITAQQFGAYATNYGYSLNRVSSITGSISRTFTYDGAGNTTGNGVATFSFDPLSQLSCMSCGTGGEVHYQYDGQGRRVSQDVGGNRTYFIQAPNGDLQFEYTPYGKRWIKHVYLQGKRVASEVGADTLATSVAASASPASATYGQTVTLSAAVAPSAATGTIEFIDVDRSLGVVSIASGAASKSVSDFSAATHTVTVNYSGDGNYQPSSTTVSVTIAKQSVSATLSGPPASATVGQSINLVATVSGTGQTGQVQFLDGTQVLGTVSLVSGSASLSIVVTTAGSHSFTAVYLGDANHNAATSPALMTTVSTVPTDLAITQSGDPNPATAGGSVVFTLTVTNNGPAAASNVTVTDEVPAGSIFSSASSGCSLSSTTVTCALGALASGASVQAVVVVQPSSAGSITNNASVAATESDPSPANNSSSVVVSVNAAPVAALFNISTRAMVLTGNDILIAGFIIGGSANKTVAILASGPSLAAQGIVNPLANPTLTLVRSSDQAVIASNDDWVNAANAAEMQASGFYPPNSLESGILMSLAPGAYTALMSGVGGGTGIGIVAVYEVDHPEIPFVNFSTRGEVLTGDGVMIGGFIVTGAPITLVVRGSGPSLVAQGIPDALANPTLTLVRSSDQTIIASNDDWGSAANAAQIQASGFAPSDPLEPAILITLNPGAYTAIMSGVGGGTGVAILGVFQTAQ